VPFNSFSFTIHPGSAMIGFSAVISVPGRYASGLDDRTQISRAQLQVSTAAVIASPQVRRRLRAMPRGYWPERIQFQEDRVVGGVLRIRSHNQSMNKHYFDRTTLCFDCTAGQPFINCPALNCV
jgi:hypothetical protein